VDDQQQGSGSDEGETGAPDPGSIEEKRRAVFESLPPEIQNDPKVRARFGLGDLVEAVAAPFAKVLGVQGCSSCQRRKAWLNKLGRR